ncbi:hypothetical protein [Cohaesibacter gelatinilyticus]|uniref:Uncharacterized protein n=1 Tax=Cohaesibacter gelatinilyticus TaxID=372072 RepID=A0A285PLD6_9HYPH|nr:hypothetical protein [Cohaesibacter gelatinilyticus]SNZ20916.1 hypothetical protein SAMN06265368_4029 [Cohaesibacter gelatinilyticus]HAT86594.1 hypothetical protein [Hyphomicrobiales bacterium]
MLLLASEFRILGFMLIAFSMILLALVGGTFSHAHEVSVEYSHKGPVHSHAEDKHHDGAQLDDNPLHCGAQILTLALSPDGYFGLPKDLHDRTKSPNLMSLSFTLDPPPPRSA